MNEKEQIAHDKALAYAQLKFPSDLSDLNNRPNHGIITPQDELMAFNYTYSNAYTFFLEEGNKF